MKFQARLLSLCLLVTAVSFGQTQPSDSLMLRNIYDLALLNGQSYSWLEHLSNEIGGRLSGSPEAEQAVKYTEQELKNLGLDSVWLQPVMVPKWVRGEKETAYFETAGSRTDLQICALGGSVATAASGLKAEVIEVQSIEALKELGEDAISGKIVFYNRPMQAELINTFAAYGGCVDQRYAGAMEAAKYGAVGVIVRSMNLRLDDYPHTGSMSYGDLNPDDRIPAAAVSTLGAEALSAALQNDADLTLTIKQSCETFPDVQSYNVIGQITGSEKPNEFFVVGGHLDSWDTGDGSHDDGAGCVQSMEVLRLLQKANYKPKHSLRVVLFMNEENGLRGGRAYAEAASKNKETHVFALESDAGAFSPRGFSFDTDQANYEQVLSWNTLFEPYLVHSFTRGGSGADIGPLKDDGIVLCGLRPDSQRYFDYHHAPNDTFDAINKRELELGAAAMASLVYLFDKYGIK
ncbi:M20/M25/M40 family metallo-hydrolase [Gilvibacter sp.]|uniref:M20/M25/M40 family metallo-hydrolase n=1 Tax=Gilvibacter sp. TaxID=2729997 RepID=UPI003F4A1D93